MRAMSLSRPRSEHRKEVCCQMPETGKTSLGLVATKMTLFLNVLQRKAGSLRVLDVLPCKGRRLKITFLRVSAAVQFISTAARSCPDRAPQNWYCWTIAFATQQKAAEQTANYSTICLQQRARKANLKIKKEQDENVAAGFHRHDL